MKKITHIIQFEEFNNINELSDDEKSLIHKAENALNNAYAPYSNFKVAAAVLLDNDEVICGTNQENAAFPSGICAERTALFYAKSTFPKSNIKKLVVVTDKQLGNNPLTLCGACRQVVSEYEQLQQQKIEIYLKSKESKIWKFGSINDLLPFSFKANVLLSK
ncbi:MAG: cytidine deaminase [Vicingaceae bacterium]